MKHWIVSLALAAAAVCAHAQAPTARVIVQFKADAASVRARALGAGESPQAVAQTLQVRAAALGNRLGLPLAAGAAVTERTQVVTATGLTSQALAARLAADPEVAYAEVDRRMHALAIPSDPLYAVGGARGPDAGQWYLRPPAGEVVSSIDAQGAWDVSKGGAAGAGVVVAVLDTGVRAEHPDLEGKLVRRGDGSLGGYDFISDAATANDSDGADADPSDPGDWVTTAEAGTAAFQGCDVQDSSWHGTQMAGLIGAATDNGIGMAGAGWHARVLPLRVLGKCGGMESDIAKAIRWAAGLAVPGVPANPTPARVLNLSLGGSGGCGPTYQQAIDAAVAAGAVVVVAAGNDGLAVGTPANCGGVIAVAGLRHTGTKVGYSDLGPEIALAAPAGNCVDLSPGAPCQYPILSTVNSGSTTPGTVSTASTYTDAVDASFGTSFATPLVSGTAALVLAVQPTLTPAGVRSLLRGTTRAFPTSGAAATVPTCRAPSSVKQDSECYCTTGTCGAGMLDAAAAVQRAAGFSVQAAIGVSPAAPAARQTVTLSSSGSVLDAGHRVAAVHWTLLDGGGIVTSLDSADSASATFRASDAGTVRVRLSVTDDYGVVGSKDETIVVAPAAPGGGGGAFSAGWLALLALAALALERTRRSAFGPSGHGDRA